MNFKIKKAVIIAPHPDDEILGVGGTIKRLVAEKVNVSLLIVSGHMPPLYGKEIYLKSVNETKKVCKYLGVKEVKFLNIPATKVNEEETYKLNKSINDFISIKNPDTVFVPFPDRHIDHRIIFDSSIVACRPIHSKAPRFVLIYETLSETHWNVPTAEPIFQPDIFINIDKYIKHKKNAMKIYKSQINSKTASRSIDAAVSLARFRGSQNGCKFAEAFKVARMVI